MQGMPEEEKKINIDKAMSQFFNLYGLLAQDAIVYLLPPKEGLQDQVYISNAAMVLPHLYKTIILANFKAPGRPGEEKVLSQFLDLMDFSQHPCPHKWEGEAETKWVREDIYLAGYGQRSEPKAYDWMEEQFGCKFIRIPMADPLRYHLDCLCFPINRECVLLAEDLPEETIAQVEKIAEVILVSKKDSQMSLTNCVRIGNVIYNATGISEMKRTHKDYEAERHKNLALEKIVEDLGLSMVWVNLSQFEASGAALSCTICHLSRMEFPSNG
jgi:N-dimethylarginine dimethylaminohydrolase